jgi:hypothetical protein
MRREPPRLILRWNPCRCELNFRPFENQYSTDFAEDMGLGKTLTTLALLCWHLDALDDESNALATAENCILRQSLIVTPKSSKPISITTRTRVRKRANHR